jgi:hypothetical protein
MWGKWATQVSRMLVSVRRQEALAANRWPISLLGSLLKPWAGIEKFAVRKYLPTSYPGARHATLVGVKREVVVTDVDAYQRKPIGDRYCTWQCESGW